MIFHRLGLIHKNQRGFTLVELIIAVAITGIIVGAATTTIFQVFSGNERTSNHMTAVRQVQNAGYWISHDTQMAQTIDPNPDDDPLTPGTEVLTLSWVGWERLDKHDNQYIDSYRVRYTYDADNYELRRYQRITTKKYDTNGQYIETIYSPSVDGWDATFIADHITVISFPPPIRDELKIIITASVGEAEEERTYEITPRPGS